MDKQIRPPWTPEQVEALNLYQQEAPMHPFTCPHRSDHPGEGELVATEAGWECPHCDYTQTWAWGFMADTSWWRTTAPPD